MKHTQRYEGDSIHEQKIILYGLKRILWRDADLAVELWREYDDRIDFDRKRADKFVHYLARYLGAIYHQEAAYWLTVANAEWQQEDWLERHIRVALREQNWAAALHWLELLPEPQRASSQWRYWRARAYEALAQQRAIANILDQSAVSRPQAAALTPYLHSRYDVMNVHYDFVQHLYRGLDVSRLVPLKVWESDPRTWTQQADAIYQSLAANRDFYGFLASQRLQQPLNLKAHQSHVTDLELHKIETYPGIQRARELYLLGRPGEDRSEWYYATKPLTAPEKSAAAKLAELWGWHNRAIITAARSDQRDNLALRFPTAYQKSVSRYSTKNGLHSDWVFSVIRQESAFMADARSSAGAMGMMQLMPGTARMVSRQAGLPYRSRRQLLDPDHNIRLGTFYLSNLLNRFDNNLILATAAYNAGPNRVERWRPEKRSLPGDIWVETIPIPETRHYVKNILTYQPIYRHHLGKQVRLTQSLGLIKPTDPVIEIPTALAKRDSETSETSKTN